MRSGDFRIEWREVVMRGALSMDPVLPAPAAAGVAVVTSIGGKPLLGREQL